MLNIIEELYHGSLDPRHASLRRDSASRDLLNQLVDCENRLRARLGDDEDGCALLMELSNLQFDQSTAELQQEYIAGFRLGALLLLDVLRPLL